MSSGSRDDSSCIERRSNRGAASDLVKGIRMLSTVPNGQASLQELESNDLRCRSVIVIDDNDSLRKALISTVTAQGYLAFGARDGKIALKTLANPFADFDLC